MFPFLTPAHKGWGYSRRPCRPGGGSGGVGGGGVKLVGVVLAKPMHRFLPNYQNMFTL